MKLGALGGDECDGSVVIEIVWRRDDDAFTSDFGFWGRGKRFDVDTGDVADVGVSREVRYLLVCCYFREFEWG